MNNCICCRDGLLRHLSHNRLYWFCPTCHQEMPNIDEIRPNSHIKRQRVKANKFDLVLS